MFKTAPKHASLVPLDGLVSASDFQIDRKEPKRHSEATWNDLLKHNGKSIKDRRSRESSPGSPPVPALPPKPKSLSPPKPPSFECLDDGGVCTHKSIENGTLVELSLKGQPIYGVVKWIGWMDESDMKSVGIELVIQSCSENSKE